MHEARSREDWTHGRADIDGIEFHYVETGERGDPFVVLLYGFPATLVIRGERDRTVTIATTEGLDQWVSDVRVERLKASHWVQNDAPERVTDLLLGSLAGNTGNEP